MSYWYSASSNIESERRSLILLRCVLLVGVCQIIDFSLFGKHVLIKTATGRKLMIGIHVEIIRERPITLLSISVHYLLRLVFGLSH